MLCPGRVGICMDAMMFAGIMPILKDNWLIGAAKRHRHFLG